ncbi:N-methyl-D-aspartate receptor NMDAR2C subunit [Variovorax sp. MHTC-1]|uniref:HD domain-containing protein n=1 Tax=Variovorax sp. MHTC-1 TaxID=2495593 RepID=UPI000F894113|nr:N-methyl-D-aspartate receptor NMDAR2C subunit [Variovorax sp. MHTC-1]RST55263.1 N-methyl-D-aspartate receptor NMDAR2C subunit [Variovorax sp. MHTC-1]
MDAGARRASWLDAWRELGAAAPEEALLAELLAQYSEPHRAYHTLQHLDECLAGLARERSHAERPAEIALALWFHDAIYDVHRHDNEARSADWAQQALRAAGVAEDAARRVHALVMATRHDAQPEGTDAQLLVDIDLSILGAPAARFAEYERQIRIEYAHVPPEVFAPRRREILGRFLARDPIYFTESIRTKLEAQARLNLQKAIG